MNWNMLDDEELKSFLADPNAKISEQDRYIIHNILSQRADELAKQQQQQKVQESIERYENALANRQNPDYSAYNDYKNRQQQQRDFIQQQNNKAQKTIQGIQDNMNTAEQRAAVEKGIQDLQEKQKFSYPFTSSTFGQNLPKFKDRDDGDKDANRSTMSYTAPYSIDFSRPFMNDDQKDLLQSTSVSSDSVLRTKKDWYSLDDVRLKQLADTGDIDALSELGRRNRNRYYMGEIAKVAKSTKNSARNIFPALSGYAASRLAGRDPMGRSAGLERQAEMHEQEAADYQKLAQQQTQIANRDYRAEAEKNAAANAAIQNAQAVANMGNASAGAAALNRNVQAADYNTMMNRQDTMRKEAMDARQRAYDAQQVAQQERTDAKGYDYVTKNAAATNAMMQNLSQGPVSNGINYKPSAVKQPDNNQDIKEEEIPENIKKWMDYLVKKYNLKANDTANPEDDKETEVEEAAK